MINVEDEMLYSVWVGPRGTIPNRVNWMRLGFAENRDQLVELYAKADAMEGDLAINIYDLLNNKNLFGRPTAKSPRRASDDCHTYS